MSALLQVRNIHTYYGAAQILDDLSFDVETGACLAILGRNGVGKTTLARALIGFTPPARGEIVLGGVPVARRPARRIVQAGMALVPQGRRVFASLTVEENLRVAAARGERTGAWTLERIYQVFPRLRERRRQSSSTLSGGEQQMLAIGRALMTNPTLLIMDEPTEGLAPIIIEDVLRIIRAVRGAGVAILLLEQRVEVAARVADRVMVMTSRGRITFDGLPAALPHHGTEVPLLDEG